MEAARTPNQGHATEQDSHQNTDQHAGLSADRIFPPEILSLPKVEIPVAGATGYCLQNEERQVVFFVFDEGVSFPDHSHREQKGMVISGEMIMEIDGESNLYQAGDHYRVPENVSHRAVFSQQTVLIDMSDGPDRYRTI